MKWIFLAISAQEKQVLAPILSRRLWLWIGLWLPAVSLAAGTPYISLSSAAANVAVGGSTTLSWASSAAQSCVASGDWQGRRDLGGTYATPQLTTARTYEYRLRCSNAKGYSDQVVFVEAETNPLPVYTSALVSDATVVSHRPEFSQPHVRWEIDFRLNSVGTKQGLVSFDENGQADAGHTTVYVNKSRRIVVRHQDRQTGSYYTKSKTRVRAGVDYEVAVEIREDEGVRLFVNGREEAKSQHGFGTQAVVRDLILGASCQRCYVGTAAPLRHQVDGVVALVIEPMGSAALPQIETQITSSATPSPADLNSRLIYRSNTVNDTTVVAFDEAFARDAALWRVKFALNSLGLEQGLVSYDELSQASAGHTLMSVLGDGRLVVRHQNVGSGSYFMRSKTLIQPGRSYTAELRFDKTTGMELLLDGVLQERSQMAFGTAATQRPMVLGASCSRCSPGTTAPITHPMNGTVALEIYASSPAQSVSLGQPSLASPSVGSAESVASSGSGSGSSVAVSGVGPRLTFLADRTDVRSGDSVELTWNAAGADTCSASGDWAGSVAGIGVRTILAGAAQRNYRLTCYGSGESVVGIVSLEVSGQISLDWQPPADNTDGSPLTDLAGYNVYYGPTPGAYPKRMVVNDPGALGTKLDLVPGEYYFVVTAVNTRGLESGFSEEAVRSVD